MAAACEASITGGEIFLALGSLKNGKVPGLDGLTKEFVLAFWSSFKDQRMPYSFKQGKIKLIPKVEIPKWIGDWRPISMMNIIYKIFTKIFALRLKPLIHKLVHSSQIGFIHKSAPGLSSESSFSCNGLHTDGVRCSHIQKRWNTLFLFPIWDSKPSKFYSTFLLFDSGNKACDWSERDVFSFCFGIFGS
ncbi:hypothetical protein KP509_02G069700 [Ceratopteris richardii]|uniref:Reverse transcriptase domain-containing protein n=1 Tax=Ceratopteris richardii TaxID=49495 RepID=A0A8T2V6T4_CERRI|nr:hypothetical protein KP509_02G069700 [Ceratopteris richardii]